METYTERIMPQEFENWMLPVVEAYGRPVLVYQMGRQNFDGANMNPIN